ncbi:MAG: TIGR02300 family protein [Rhodobacteraceae bacterium]|nr:TIGR02300 family protein [Paracoccaceae bacterium]
MAHAPTPKFGWDTARAKGLPNLWGRSVELKVAKRPIGGASVGKVDLGMKLTCESCGTRFYDLNKQPGVCPKCGASNQRPQVFRSRRSAEDREEKKAAAAAAAAKKTAMESTEADDVGDDDDDDEDVIEDTSDLGEDDDVDVVVQDDEGS